MRIVRNYESPVEPGVLINDRLYATRWLLDHRQDYDAFILGSSRSRAFLTRDWERHLPTDAAAYHVGMNDESLYGIAHRIALVVGDWCGRTVAVRDGPAPIVARRQS